jgi:hypothetical protein
MQQGRRAMTIFVELAQKLIIKDLKRIRANAISKDKGTITGLVRGTDLSLEKQNIIDEYIIKMGELEPEDEDIKTRDAINQLLIECRQKTIAKAKEFEKSIGATEKSLDKSVTLLHNLFGLCNSHELVDTKHTKEAINILKFHMIGYVADKLYNTDREGGLLSTITSFFGNSKSLEQKKEEAALKCITEALEDISGLNKKLKDFGERSTRAVLTRLKLLRFTNDALCSESKSGVDLPVSFSILGGMNIKPGITPSPGDLGKAIMATEKEIVENSPILEEDKDALPDTTLSSLHH